MTFTTTLDDYVDIATVKSTRDSSDCSTTDANFKILETYNDLCNEMVNLKESIRDLKTRLFLLKMKIITCLKI